jgi:RAT1-interacting protein
MEEQVTKKKENDEKTATDRHKLMCYWGYRFESLCTTSNPPHKVTKQELEQRLTDSANSNIQYCILVKTKLGRNSIIMGAEVDCCRGIYIYKKKSYYVSLTW